MGISKQSLPDALRFTALLGVALSLFLFFSCTEEKKNSTVEVVKKDTLLYLNHADTAYYVGINTCKLCHQGIYNTFIETGMGKSFAAATKEKSAGDFSHSLIYDEFSDFYYKSFWGKNDSLYFKEFRLQGKDTVYKRVEKCDYIIGSGHHTNSHIQNINGYFNQMPMTFYTQKKEWHLPPGFENGVNTRFTRKIGLECMSCHNALPDFVLGSENKYNKVPDGINCERCHGPGSVHVQQRSTGSKIDTANYIDYSIVNPSKLSINLQFDVCQRCHLQGNAVLKEDKSFFDFKPGMKLSDYISVFLPKYKNTDDEFIMASHADRLKMSQCFIKSFNPKEVKNKLKPYKDALTCVTCHNPHISVKATGSEVFNNACKNCHQPGGKSNLDCTDKNVIAAKNAKQGHAPSQLLNCVNCHMPKSGSIDIPHVTVHDHYIRKPISKQEKEKIKTFLGLFAINEKTPDSLTKAKAYIYQYEKFEQKSFYLDSAVKYLSTKNLRNFDALVQLYFLKNDYAKVGGLVLKTGHEELLKNRLNKKTYDNQHAWTCYRIAECFTYLNNNNEALLFLEQANKLAPFVPEFTDKLATAYAMVGNNKMAKQYFESTLKENPKYVPAISNLGFLYLSEGNTLMAEQLYKKALALDPDNEDALMNMAGLYNFKGDKKGAMNILKQLIKKHPNNKRASEILKALEKDKSLAVK
ncbi:MAG TPA: tetratricopeptide repeat protein [Bacteroidia bacterium]|nr:tetratricopeptide repeat protein [Bacteroidia bacterium]